MTIAMPRLDRSTAAERGLTIADFLVPITVAERLNTRVRDSILIAAGAMFVYLTSLIVVPHDPVPWTGQTFGVLMVGGALGLRRGLLAVALYVLLGYVGLPFFAEGKSGASIILGATGGYLIGFIVAGAVVGRLAELGWDRHLGGAIGMMLVGSVIIYAIGLPWLGAHFRLDALAAFFLVIVNLGSATSSLFGLGYGRHEETPGRVLLGAHVA